MSSHDAFQYTVSLSRFQRLEQKIGCQPQVPMQHFIITL